MPSEATLDLTPARLNLVLQQGSDLDGTVLSMVWKSGGQAVDLAGYTGRAEFYGNLKSPPLLSLTTANGGLVLGPSGKIELVVTAAASSALTVLEGVWSLLLTSPAGKSRTLLAGRWRFVREVAHG